MIMMWCFHYPPLWYFEANMMAMLPLYDSHGDVENIVICENINTMSKLQVYYVWWWRQPDFLSFLGNVTIPNSNIQFLFQRRSAIHRNKNMGTSVVQKVHRPSIRDAIPNGRCIDIPVGLPIGLPMGIFSGPLQVLFWGIRLNPIIGK